MNHETLQALYALDVAEVGEEEAAKRWEYWSGTYWRYNERFPKIIVKPSWCEDVQYRRKPGIPWPKVMVQDTKPAWPADAPEWANYMATDGDGQHKAFSNKPLHSEMNNTWVAGGGKYLAYNSACPNWRDSLIERPKPVLKKIDWSKLRKVSGWWRPTQYAIETRCVFPSDWIAWNCDENTRGNPLPDGLMVEVLYLAQVVGILSNSTNINWSIVTRFRIIGIRDGWE